MYFAYGTNLDFERLKKRCPSVQKIAKAFLVDYQFIFNTRGVATVVPKKDSKVYGILFEIEDSEIKNLDKYEGVPKLYAKQDKKVLLENGKTTDALLYIAIESKPGKSRERHLKIILESMIKEGFPSKYLESIKKYGL